MKRERWIGALFLIGSAACTNPAPNAPEGSNARSVYTGALGSTSFNLTMPTVVRPPGSNTGAITVDAVLADIPANTGVLLRFTGDTGAWPDADLPQIKRKGNKFTFTKNL